MKLPRDLSGAELVKVLSKHYGYARVHQEGATSSCKRSGQCTIGFPCRSISLCGSARSTPSSTQCPAQGVTKDAILEKL